MDIAVTADPGAVAEGLADRLADGDGAVFRGVVLVHMKIALDAAGDVDQRMAAELLDHMVEKADPGGDLIGSRAVQVDLHGDVGLVSLADDRGCAHGCAYKPVHAGINSARHQACAKSVSKVIFGRSL